MTAESFARWHIPRQIDGILLLGDFEHGPGRSGYENRHVHAELELHLVTQGRCVFLLGEHRIEADAARSAAAACGSPLRTSSRARARHAVRDGE